MKIKKFPIVLTTAGHLHQLECSSFHSQCGQIKDGISFRFGNEGSWVVDKQDLLKLALMIATESE